MSIGERKEEMKKQLEHTLGEIRTLANDIREKLGTKTAGAREEAHAAWAKLEAEVKEKLEVADRELQFVSETAGKQLKVIYGDLKTSLKSLRERLT